MFPWYKENNVEEKSLLPRWQRDPSSQNSREVPPPEMAEKPLLPRWQRGPSSQDSSRYSKPHRPGDKDIRWRSHALQCSRIKKELFPYPASTSGLHLRDLPQATLSGAQRETNKSSCVHFFFCLWRDPALPPFCEHGLKYTNLVSWVAKS